MAQKPSDQIAALYETEFNKLYRVAYRLSGTEEAAKDLVQGVFLQALSHRATLLAHPQPEAWLMQTLCNLAKNAARRASLHDISLETLFHIPTPEPADIEALLPDELPEDDRKILLWRFGQELDYRELSKRLGISEDGCRSRVARAIKRCRKLSKRKDFPSKEK